MRTVADRLSEFICNLSFERVPVEVIEKVKICSLYCIGNGMASYNLPTAKAARDLIKKYEPGNAATLIGGGGKVSLMGAAFANSILFHARGVDDTHGSSHFGTTIIPPALAVSEFIGASGREFLLSVITGYEVGAAVSKDLTALTTPRGFRASAIFGILGVAAAVSRLLGYSVSQIRDSLGMAAAFAGGTTEQYLFGSAEGKFQVGMAARNGIMAALLPGFGMDGAGTSIEGRAGFCKAFAGSAEKIEKIGEELGRVYEILNVTFKPYPACVYNQTPINAMQNLVKKYDVQPSAVQKIQIFMNPYDANYPGLKYCGPFINKYQQQLSTAFLMAKMLVDRKIGAIEECLNDPNIMSLCNKTEIVDDNGICPLCCRLRVQLTDGKILEENVSITPEYYFFDMEKTKQFIRTLHEDNHIPETITINLINHIQRIEALHDLKTLTDLICWNKEVR